MYKIKSLAMAVTACFLLTSHYAVAEYVQCNSQTISSVTGEIEYVSSECKRSDGTNYFQSQVHLDLMSAGANRPSNDPVVEEVVAEVDPQVALKAEIEQTIVDFNDYASIFFALTTNSEATDAEKDEARQRVSDAAKKIIALRTKIN